MKKSSICRHTKFEPALYAGITVDPNLKGIASPPQYYVCFVSLQNDYIVVGGPGNEQFAGGIFSRNVSDTERFTQYSPDGSKSLHLGQHCIFC